MKSMEAKMEIAWNFLNTKSSMHTTALAIVNGGLYVFSGIQNFSPYYILPIF